MKKLEYKILNYLKEKQKEQKEINIEKYWSDFHAIAKKSNEEKISISYEDFKIIITEIYNILILRIPEIKVHQIINKYLTILLSDIYLNNQEITVSHCLESMYQLTTLKDKKITKKYADDIPFIENNLHQKLKIPETKIQKVKRKARTKVLIKIGKPY